MKKITITEKDVGKEYLDVLKEVVKIRKQRRKIYGDDYGHPPEVEVWTIYQKTFRMIKLFKDGNSNYEKIDDTLRDLINYSLFLLIKISNKKKNGK